MNIEPQVPDLERILRRARRLLLRRTVIAVAAAVAASSMLVVGGHQARARLSDGDDPAPGGNRAHYHHHHGHPRPPTSTSSTSEGTTTTGPVAPTPPDHPVATTEATLTTGTAPPGPRRDALGTSVSAFALAVPGRVRAVVAQGRRGPYVRLSWVPVEDRTVSEYTVYRNGRSIGSVPAPAADYADTDVGGGTYLYDVEARDATGRRSPRSDAAVVSVPPADVTPPSAPSDVWVTREDGTPTTDRFTIAWTGSTDNVGVVEYRVYYADEWVGTVRHDRRSFVDVVAEDAADRYSVRARDAAGNESAAGIKTRPPP